MGASVGQFSFSQTGCGNFDAARGTGEGLIRKGTSSVSIDAMDVNGVDL